MGRRRTNQPRPKCSCAPRVLTVSCLTIRCPLHTIYSHVSHQKAGAMFTRINPALSQRTGFTVHQSTTNKPLVAKALIK